MYIEQSDVDYKALNIAKSYIIMVQLHYGNKNLNVWSKYAFFLQLY